VDSGSLLSGIVLGSLGMGYFIYGKRQGRIVALCCGILLCGLPYLMDSQLLLWLLSLPIMLLPWFVRL
jgi:hypothetical protein